MADEWARGVSVIGFDGDDTLWHSEDAFAEAQEQLADLLAAHASGEQVMARLREIELRNLELFGYGVKGFTLSMIETAIEISAGRVPVSDIQRLLNAAHAMLRRPVELLPGVAETLPTLAEGFRLMLITKGDLLNQESKIARSGLAELFATVSIVSEKNHQTYRRELGRLDLEPDAFVMVGNSLVSDIWPVVELGGRAVYLPYPLTSVHESGRAERALPDAVRTVSRMDDLIDLFGVTR